MTQMREMVEMLAAWTALALVQVPLEAKVLPAGLAVSR